MSTFDSLCIIILFWICITITVINEKEDVHYNWHTNPLAPSKHDNEPPVQGESYG